MEFVEKDAINISEAHLNKKWPCREGNAFLMIIIDAGTEDEAMTLAESISRVCAENNALDVFIADSKQKQDNILQIRSNIYESIKKYMLEDLDICIPRAQIGDFVADTHKLEQEYDVWIPTYGHAADGNVHNHIMSHRWIDNEWKEIENWKEKFSVVSRRLHELGKKYHGIVSGEHGIGAVKKEYLGLFLDKEQIELMKKIKQVFDPDNILNPGKIFDL